MAVNVAQVEVRFTQDGQQVENVFHVVAATPLPQSEADTIFNIVNDWARTTLRPHQANNVIYREVEIFDPNGAGQPRFVYAGTGQSGTQSGTPLPNEVTYALKKNTGISGRKFRGRFFHIGLTNTVVNSNTLVPAEVTALVTIYEALRTSLATASHPLVVAYRDYSVPNPHPIVGAAEVLSITAVDAIVDAQRRRGPGRGR